MKHFQNLIYVNLTNNRITNLPKEFGTLPLLQRLDLSHNCLGTPGQYKWLWIEQFAIRKNLLYLNISYNLLKELPMYIEKLYALRELKVCHNLLQCLPASIGNFDNLKILDVSHNCLLYLPINIRYIQPRMDISKNPFLSINLHHSRIEYRAVPTLVELSANIVLEHRIVYNVNLIPYTLVVYLDKVVTCDSCGANIYSSQWCKAVYLNYNDDTMHDTMPYMKHEVVKLELNYCLFCCHYDHV